MMNKPWIFALIAALASLFLAASAPAQEKKMYSWTDEDGTVHFSDQQPQNVDAVEQALPQDTTSVTANPDQTLDTSGPSAAQQRREEIARNNQQQKAERAVRSAECSAWQAEVNRLEPNRRVFFTNEQGETERMDDVERTNRVAELKRMISQNCD